MYDACSLPRSGANHSTVPSIATEFLRKRPTHDQTARRWTELYARPPPPPPSSRSASPQQPSSTNNASASTTATTTTTTVSRASSKGKGRANGQPAVADGGSEPEVAGIDLTNEGLEPMSLPAPARGTKRRRDVQTTDSVIDLSEEVVAESDSSSQGAKRRHVETLGDVIIIED